MTKNAFMAWAIKFIAYIDSIRESTNTAGQWHLLLVDGHKSRLQPEVLQALLNRGIMVQCSPSHTTHLIQPNDSTFNAHVHRGVDRYISKIFEAREVPNTDSFGRALMEALKDSSVANVITKSWAHVGVWPSDQVKREKVLVREYIVDHSEKSPELELAVDLTK